MKTTLNHQLVVVVIVIVIIIIISITISITITISTTTTTTESTRSILKRVDLLAGQAVAFLGLLLGRFILQLVEQGLTGPQVALELTPQMTSLVGKLWENGEQSMHYNGL